MTKQEALDKAKKILAQASIAMNPVDGAIDAATAKVVFYLFNDSRYKEAEKIENKHRLALNELLNELR